MNTYFAGDGSFGSADGMVIIDTRAWSEDDWTEIEYASENLRTRVAVEIAIRNGDM